MPIVPARSANHPALTALATLILVLGASSAFASPFARYDHILPLAGAERFDGSTGAPAIDTRTFRQLADELHRGAEEPFTPDARAFAALAAGPRAADLVPIALIDAAFEQDGARHEVFAFAPLASVTWRGAAVRFRLDPAAAFGAPPPPGATLTFDPGDGAGPRLLVPGREVLAAYAAPGRRVLKLVERLADGSSRTARAAFEVAGLVAPTPDDTLHVTASIPYQGVAGTGQAYVRLAPGHAALTNPVLLIEGFDLDNSMHWDELYALMNVEGLADSLAAEGYDAVVLDFTDATDAIQRNSYVVEQLIEDVQSAVPGPATLAVIGASMGGLCSRFALADLETRGQPHRVRTWISFDSPHDGAVIPLGVQNWVDFFAGQSADAALLRDELNRPAARQMLIQHYLSTSGTTAAPDPLRAVMLQDFAAIGDWPQQPRRVSVVNGSGLGQSQGFAPAAQLVRYEYQFLFVVVTGNVWALADGASQRVFNGRYQVTSNTTRQVTIAGSPPWDGAPGGWRASMAEMDAVQAPVGDIVALHPNHCFIPTVSALALGTNDPFDPIVSDPDLVAHTPFDAVYVPAGNQSHVEITAENSVWLRNELRQGVTAAPPSVTVPRLALRAAPNPFRGEVRMDLASGVAAGAALDVFGVDGRRVRTLHTDAAGQARWDGRDGSGRAVPAGVYLVRAGLGGASPVRRIVKLD